MSLLYIISHGDLQGSVFRPAPFTLYICSLGYVIRPRGIRSTAINLILNYTYPWSQMKPQARCVALAWLPLLPWGIFEFFLTRIYFLTHIKQVSRTTFFYLHNIARNILSQSDSENLVHSFYTSELDYSNFLLLDCPKNSQKSLLLMQNATARVVINISRKNQSYSSNFRLFSLAPC